MKIKLFKKYKAVVYLSNLYTLLQYMLLEPYRMEDTLFFIHDKFPPSIAHRLPNSVFLHEGSAYENLISLIKTYWFILRTPTIPVFLAGHLAFTDTLLRSSKNVIYLEDGAGSYECVYKKNRQVRCKRKKRLIRLLFGDLYPWYGLAENVQKIYLTGILPVPEMIAEKVEFMNLKNLWYQKKQEQQEAIIRIFLPLGFDRNIIREYDIILLTQPFSEYSSGRFSEREKIEVYRKIISGYDESKIVIKTHPSETTDYSLYFPKARIVNISCPMELLVFMGFKAKTMISVSSSSIFGISDFREKIISGYDVTPALKEDLIKRGMYDDISNKKEHIRHCE